MTSVAQSVRVIATGVYVDTYPDPERALAETAAAFGGHLSPEARADIAQWRAGELEFIRLTPFVEFDDGFGDTRWHSAAPHRLDVEPDLADKLVLD
jgi:hypothetical protein